MKVLIVDDNSLNRTFLRRLLERHFSAEVAEAEDGRQGLERLAEERPDLVILDVHMPGADGASVLRRIREDPRNASLPVVAVSGLADRKVVEEMKALGARDYFLKPLEVPKVLARLERILERG